MEFVRRIGELAQLTRRLTRVQVDKANAQRILASCHSPPAAPSTASSRQERVKEEEKHVVRLSRVRQRERQSTPAEASRATLARCAAAQDEMLFRRIPVAVSRLERSWYALHRWPHWQKDEHSYVSTESREVARRQYLGSGGDIQAQQLPRDTPAASPNPASRPPTQEQASAPSSEREHAKVALFKSELASVRNNFTKPPISTRQLEAVTLLAQQLHALEQARRQHLDDKQRAAQRRCDDAEAAWQHFRRDFAPQLRALHTKGHEREKDILSDKDATLLEETEDTLQQRRQEARVDMQLLQASLLTRPLLSARLWRLWLCDSLWTTAVREHRLGAAAISGGAESLDSSVAVPRSATSVTQLLLLSLALSRVTAGVLRDYVHGASLSRQAPRFVVSLPSRRFRARLPKRMHGGEDNSALVRKGISRERREVDRSLISDNEGGDVDPLLSMLQAAEAEAPQPLTEGGRNGGTSARQQQRRESSSTTLATTSATERNVARTAHPSMRWITPHSAAVVPLATETLALYTFLLPELNVSALLRCGCAMELVGLCVSLQSIATTVLALSPPEPTGRTATAASLHRTLHDLEGGIAAVGSRVLDHLVWYNREGNGDMSRTPLSPEEAAQLAVQLESLHLLPTGSADVQVLLHQWLTDIFPELRTSTSRVLQEKARQSSLLAFATRPHRQKLYQQHGRRRTESYLLETTVQHARLQQRQLTAALREHRLSAVHVQVLSALGRALPAGTLVKLFQLYTRHACAVGLTSASSSEGPVASSPSFDTWITGCLFLAETLLLSDTMESAGNTTRTAASSRVFSLHVLATLWDAAALLLPHIHTRRARQLAKQRVPGSSRSSFATSVANTEMIIWATFAEHVLLQVNARLAERLQRLQLQRQTESTAMRRGKEKQLLHGTPPTAISSTPGADTEFTQHQVSVTSLVALAAGILEYVSHDESLRHDGVAGGGGSLTFPSSRMSGPGPSSLHAVQQSVRVLSHLLRELVLHDRDLWHAVRVLPSGQRGAVERQLQECFHTLGLFDDTTSQALKALNRDNRLTA